MDISNINPFTKIDLPTLAEVDRMNKPQLEKTMADMVHLVVTCDPLFAALSESVRTSQNNRSVIDMAYFKQNFKINKKLDKKKLEEYLKKYSKEFRDEFYNFTKLK